jgi:DNA-directed RNA polymerase specialized sigma24 family protein
MSEDKNKFASFAQSYAAFLRIHAASEIEKLEREGVLPHERRSVAGIVDETFLRAWSLRARKPAAISVEEWLVDVLVQVLNVAIRHVGETTPVKDAESWEEDETVDFDESSSQWRQCHILESHDPDIWEDHFPDRKARSDLQEITIDDERESVLRSLGALPESDREAFVLFAFDGYACQEIAEFQKRDVGIVQAAVRTGCDRLLPHLPTS